MQVEISLKITLSLDKEVSLKDKGLNSRIDDLPSELKELVSGYFDFQSDDDEDVSAKLSKCDLDYIK